MRTAGWLLGAVAGAGLLVSAAAGEFARGGRTPPEGLVASPEPDWPQWRGRRRDGTCQAEGLLTRWPAGGPPLVWKVTGLGRGWSSPVICRGRLYITGDVGERLVIRAFDLSGRALWSAANGRSWRRSFPGARACCLYLGGRLYHMNAHGRVVCLDAADGRELWAVDTLRRFEAPEIRWGHSECLLADGGRIIVTPGGRKAMMAALDARTGRRVWATGPLGEETASYASPVLFAWGGRRHIVSCSSRRGFGVDAETGTIQWSVPRPTQYQAIATTPFYRDGRVLFASPDGRSAELYRLVVRAGRTAVEKVWQSEMMDMSGCFTFADGRLYGSGYRRTFPGWAAVDFRSGQVVYRLKDLPRGAHVLAGGMLHCVSETGEAVLLRPGQARYEVRGRFRPVAGRCRDFWAHPVIHAGRLYLRYHETLWCYDISARSGAAGG